MTITEQDESKDDVKKPLYKRRRVVVAAGLLLILLVFGLFLNKLSSNYLNERLRAVHSEFKDRVKAKKREPLLGPSTPGNAIDDYNAIRYMCLPNYNWLANPPKNLPKTDYPFNYFNKNDIFVLDYARYLSDTLDLEAKYERFQGQGSWYSDAQGVIQLDFDTAKTFFDKYSKSITRHVRSGVRRERLDYPLDFGSDPEKSSYQSEALIAAAQLLAVEAALQKEAQESIETVAVLLAFAADMEQLPLDSGVELSFEIKEVAFNALEWLLRKKLLIQDCKRLAKILRGVPRMDPETSLFVQDSNVAADFARSAELDIAPKIKGFENDYLRWGSFGQLKINLALAWLVYDNISSQQSQIMKLPSSQCLKEYEAMEGDFFHKISALKSSRCIHEYIYSRPLVINTHHDLLQLALATRIYQLKNKKWPQSTSEIQPHFKGPVPKDPFSDGQSEYILTIKGKDLVLASSSPPKSHYIYPLSVRIGAPAK